MEQEKKQAVDLMHYLAIGPLITRTQEDYESLSCLSYTKFTEKKRQKSLKKEREIH